MLSACAAGKVDIKGYEPPEYRLETENLKNSRHKICIAYKPFEKFPSGLTDPTINSSSSVHSRKQVVIYSTNQYTVHLSF